MSSCAGNTSVISCSFMLAIGGRHGTDAARSAAFRQFLQMANELPRAVVPRVVEREGPTRIARHVEGAQTRRAQILVQRADRMVADHVLGAGHRKGGD